MVSYRRIAIWRLARMWNITGRVQRFTVICVTIYAIAVLLYSFLQINILSRHSIEWSIASGRCTPSIDIVYTWVNGTDPAHRQARLETLNHILTGTLHQYCINITNLSQPQLLPVMAIRPPLLFNRTVFISPKHRRHRPEVFLQESALRVEQLNSNISLIYFRYLSDVARLSTNCVLQFGDRFHQITPLVLSKDDTDSVLQLMNIFLHSRKNTTDSEQKIPLTKFRKLEFSSEDSDVYLPKNPDKNLTQMIENFNSTILHPLLVKFLDSSFLERSDWNENIDANRFADNDELMYSLRSVEKFAPWIRNIYLVTNGQIPSWLNIANPKIRLVTHEQIFPNHSHLPTFSSSAIESHLHRIPELSQRFLYFNDDVILGERIFLDDFYTDSGGFKIRFSWPVPNCAPGCPVNWLSDGSCDKSCNTTKCMFDGGDCLIDEQAQSMESAVANGSVTLLQPWRHGRGNNLPFQAPDCATHCLANWLGDGFCDQVCNRQECGFDMADCGTQNFTEYSQILLTYEENSYLLPEQPENQIQWILYFNLTELKNFKFAEQNYELDILDIDSVSEPEARSIVWNQNLDVLVFMTNLERLSQISLNITVNVGNLQFSYISNLYRNEDLQTQNKNLGENIDYKQNIRNEILDFQSRIQNITLRSGSKQQPNSIEFLTDLNICSKSELQTENIRGNDSTNPENSKLVELYSNLVCEQNLENEERNLPILEWMKKIIHERNGTEYSVNKNLTVVYHKRKLLEAYADSLIHVNNLYNRHFGKQIRQVPAHIAHFLDKNILSRMHTQFAKEFEATSASRIRTGRDMQFAFSYFYFLMYEVPPNKSLHEILQNFDTDQSGKLSRNEQRTVALRYYNTIEEYKNDLMNCSLPSIEEGEEAEIDVESLILCLPFHKTVSDTFSTAGKRNLYQTLQDSDVAFKMLRSNSTQLLAELDDLRKNPKKFICLNDNFNYLNLTEALELRQILRDFYESQFPFPSQFELLNSTQKSVYNSIYSICILIISTLIAIL